MKPMRFKVNYEKCIQGMHFLALHKPGITQYYVGKVFFFADREHLLDWGRPISGDRYVAMEHGPVPSVIYDLVKNTSGQPDEIADLVSKRLELRTEGNRIHLHSKVAQPEFPELSGTDKEYLSSSLDRYGAMSFGCLRELSHQDKAYETAWALTGMNNEMNPALWFEEIGDQDAIIASLLEKSVIERFAH